MSESTQGSWDWACERLLAGKTVRSPLCRARLKMDHGELCYWWNASESWRPATVTESMLVVTDWQVVEERAKTWEQYCHELGIDVLKCIPEFLRDDFPQPELIYRMVDFFSDPQPEHRSRIQTALRKWKTDRKESPCP